MAMTSLIIEPYLRPETARLQPITALQALGRLMRDKEDTSQVFVLMRALSGRSLDRGFQRMLRDAEGGRQVFMGRELTDRFGDVEWLEQLPPGSLGASYRAFMTDHGFEADGLMTADGSAGLAPIPHPRAWYGRRLRDLHDVWHVLAGYNTDPLGEACVVAFSFAQTGQLGFAAIALGAAREIQREDPGIPALKTVLEAYGAGRRAAWLPAQDYERLFERPLDEVQTALKLPSPLRYRGVCPDRLRKLRLRSPAAEAAPTADARTAA